MARVADDRLRSSRMPANNAGFSPAHTTCRLLTDSVDSGTDVADWISNWTSKRASAASSIGTHRYCHCSVVVSEWLPMAGDRLWDWTLSLSLPLSLARSLVRSTWVLVYLNYYLSFGVSELLNYMCSISRSSPSLARAGCKKTLCLLHYPRKIKFTYSFIHSPSLSLSLSLSKTKPDCQVSSKIGPFVCTYYAKHKLCFKCMGWICLCANEATLLSPQTCHKIINANS